MRMTALLVVIVMAGAQASAVTCDLACAASVAVSPRAGGCHAEVGNATGLRVAPAAALCDHDAVGPWLIEVRQRAPESVTAAMVPTADAMGTNAPLIDSINSLRLRHPESPPPLGSVRSPILRI